MLDNLKYIYPNLSSYSQVEIIEIGASNRVGTATFYEESLTGQNNSLIQDYDVLKTNASSSGVGCEIAAREIPTTTLDQFTADHKVVPNFIKVDIAKIKCRLIRGLYTVQE